MNSHHFSPRPQLERPLFLPDWIAEHLEARFGSQVAQSQLRRSIARDGCACVRAAPVRLQSLLGASGVTRSSWASQGLLVTTPRPNLLGLGPQFLGRFEVQDEGSQLLGELVDAHSGDTVLDLCAGAGGKSLQLAALVGPQGEVHATDIDLHRLERLRSRAAKAEAHILIHGKEAPANMRASRVLVDAPCSELGVLRRGPDLRWRLDPSLVKSLPQIQRHLIDRGLRHLAPGGRLVYDTCTITREAEAVVEAMLDSPRARARAAFPS